MAAANAARDGAGPAGQPARAQPRPRAAATSPPSRARSPGPTSRRRPADPGDRLRARRRPDRRPAASTEVDPAPRTGAGRPARGLALAAGPGRAGPGGQCRLPGRVRGRPHRQVRATTSVRRGDQRGRDPAPMSAPTWPSLAGQPRSRQPRPRASPWPAPRWPYRAWSTATAGPARAEPGLARRRRAGGTSRPALTAVPGVPALVVDNEANLAALGELHAGRTDPRPASFLYISGEIGIGAGIVLDGALFRGARGFERRDRARDRSGPTGRRAAAARGAAWRATPTRRRSWRGRAGSRRRAIRQDTAPPWPGSPSWPAPGDPRPAGAARRPAPRSASPSAGVVNLLDVDTVVLGGIYAPLAPWLRAPVARRDRRARAHRRLVAGHGTGRRRWARGDSGRCGRLGRPRHPGQPGQLALPFPVDLGLVLVIRD